MDKKVDIKVMKYILAVFALGIILGFGLGFLVSWVKDNHESDKQETVSENTVSDVADLQGDGELLGESLEEITGESAVNYIDVEISDEEAKEAIERLSAKLEDITHDNSYIQLYVGDGSYNTYVYNKKGESIFVMYDGTEFSVTRSDGLTAMFSNGDVVTGPNLSIIDNIVNVVKEPLNNDECWVGKVEEQLADGEESVRDYESMTLIKITNRDMILDIYSGVGDEYTETVADQIEELFGDTFELRFYFTEYTDGSLVIESSYIDPEDGEEYLSYYIDGAFVLDDWELSEEWYESDLSGLSAEELEEMADVVFSDAKELILKYAEENGLEVEEIDYSQYDEESTEESAEDVNIEESTEVEEETESNPEDTVTEEIKEDEEEITEDEG